MDGCIGFGGPMFDTRAQLVSKLEDGEDDYANADTLRILMATSSYLFDKSNRDVSLEHEVNRTSFLHYSKVMDNMRGINNYAPSILGLCRGCKNESKQWRSTLTEERLLELFPTTEEEQEPLDMKDLKDVLKTDVPFNDIHSSKKSSNLNTSDTSAGVDSNNYGSRALPAVLSTGRVGDISSASSRSGGFGHRRFEANPVGTLFGNQPGASGDTHDAAITSFSTMFSDSNAAPFRSNRPSDDPRPGSSHHTGGNVKTPYSRVPPVPGTSHVAGDAVKTPYSRVPPVPGTSHVAGDAVKTPYSRVPPVPGTSHVAGDAVKTPYSRVFPGPGTSHVARESVKTTYSRIPPAQCSPAPGGSAAATSYSSASSSGPAGTSRGYFPAPQKRGYPAGPSRATAEDEQSVRGKYGGRNWKRGNYKRGRGFGRRNRYSDSEDEGGDDGAGKTDAAFTTAKDKLVMNQLQSRGYTAEQAAQKVTSCSYGSNQRSLGTRRGFVPPVKSADSNRDGASSAPDPQGPEAMLDERLKNIEPRMVELIMSEIMDRGPPIAWEDIAGLEFAKNTIKEIVIWPLLRPDIFTGLRGPPKGLLLFGPPGTGKTLIGKCIASQSQSTFFSISASSLTSKWVGEGEKMVRALFSVARCHQPAVIFIDEIDSLLSQRSETEHESSRRIKTEFLVQLDGAATDSEDRLLVVGATNRPQELDEAARRRLVKRLYVPLPEQLARQQMVTRLLRSQRHQLNGEQLQEVAQRSAGFSGADMANLCREAALGPIRSISIEQIHSITPDQVRPVTHQDFLDALNNMRASVSPDDLQIYVDWNNKYGTGGVNRV